MAISYKVVDWNKNKRQYDIALGLGVILYLAGFILTSLGTPQAGHAVGPVVMIIRAFGTCAFLMLTMILCIGPLARISTVFLPLLYNRRHFGVLTFFIALIHFAAALGWYFASGVENPFVALFAMNTDYGDLRGFPFEALGVIGLLILFLMAATSHDFWLKALTPPIWKFLHMGAYIVYGSVCLHIALGILQDEMNPLYWAWLIVSVALVGGLQVTSGIMSFFKDLSSITPGEDWREVCKVSDIAEGRGKPIAIEGQDSIAVFRYDGKISATTNACAHQNGPLGEGRIIDGCITCPWHGHQFNPADGCAPAPYTDKIATYRVKIENGKVYVNLEPLPLGTRVEPALISGGAS